MPARLVPLSAGTAPTISVQRPVILVGRHPECDVRIDLPKISRRHCCIALAYERLVIRDLGSRNGLRVNGMVVEESSLEAGDEVAIGPILFRVENPDVAPLPMSRPAAAPKLEEVRPPSLPYLPHPPNDLDGDLIPIDL